MQIPKPNLSSIKAKLDDVQLSDVKAKLPNKEVLTKLKPDEESLAETAMTTVTAAVKLPFVKVDREEFLRSEFKDHEHLDIILERGPQAVFTTEALAERAKRLVSTNTRNTTAVSFAAGLPANAFVAVPAAGADVAQFFGFALRMAQQISYLFGEKDLFTGEDSTLNDEAKLRVFGYLGAMFGIAGGAALINKAASMAAAQAGKKVTNKALTKTVWYPVVKKVAAMLGQKITKQSVGSAVTKVVPVLGGVVAGTLTYATFRPMGQRLTDVFVNNLKGTFDLQVELKDELNPEFLKELEEEEAKIIDGEVLDD